MGAVFYFCAGCGQRFDVNLDRPTAPSTVRTQDGRDLWVLQVEGVEVHRCDMTDSSAIGGQLIAAAPAGR